MDLTTTTQPKSDQLNYDDVANVSVIVTIDDVRQGNSEQPVEIHLVEFPGRPFKPSKSMRRVFVNAWGPDSKTYKGRRLKLYGDSTVKFGGQTVGGIRISHMSHIDKRLSIPLTVTRGKRAPFNVEPLGDEQPTSKIRLDEAKIAASTIEQCTQARTYLAKYQATEPDRVAALLDLVAKRETQLAADTGDDAA